MPIRANACLRFPSRPEVSPEGHLAVTTEPEIRLWDATNGRLNGTIVLLADDRYVAIGPFGDFDGSPGVEKSLVYVTEANGVQETLSPAEFQGRFRHNEDRGAHLARPGRPEEPRCRRPAARRRVMPPPPDGGARGRDAVPRGARTVAGPIAISRIGSRHARDDRRTPRG